MIAYGRQDITQADIDAVVSVLRSDFLTQGAQVRAFEQAVANHCHSVAVDSATSGLVPKYLDQLADRKTKGGCKSQYPRDV